MTGLSRDPAPTKRPQAYRVSSPTKLATGAQLWRLNEQGLLRLELSATPYLPGVPAHDHAAIADADAHAALARLLDERWPGLGRWPGRGESWRVEDGLVLPLAKPKQEESRT